MPEELTVSIGSTLIVTPSDVLSNMRFFLSVLTESGMSSPIFELEKTRHLITHESSGITRALREKIRRRERPPLLDRHDATHPIGNHIAVPE